MKVNRFIQCLTDPQLISTVPGSEIQDFIEEFPFCQTGRLIYCIHLNLTDDIRYEDQLKNTAAYCADRVRLFEHTNPNLGLEQPVESVSLENEEVKESKLDTINDLSDSDNDLKVLEREYLSEAVNSTILLESDETHEVLEKDEPKIDVEEELEEVNLFDFNEDHTFSDWLKYYSGEDKEVIPKKERTKNKQANDELINKFIQENPRIKPKKTPFYSPTNMARLSVTDSGIVSETLALVHVEQENFQEAINIYEKLSLKNPKKRSYFAAQIEILKKKLKQ